MECMFLRIMAGLSVAGAACLVVCSIVWADGRTRQTRIETSAPPVVAPVSRQANALAGGSTAVRVYEGQVTLPTYPYERYQTPAFAPLYRWPFARFDLDRFRQDNPAPALRTYRTMVLENEFLRIIVLPQLGGRIWRVIHKPTGNDLFYHNPVVKPTAWGPTYMQGWLALGGLEWNLPVVEHGYDWGTEWPAQALQKKDQASIVLSTPADGRVLSAQITVTLAAGEAAFRVEPSISNVSTRPVSFAYWQNAALAPGRANQPSAATHIVVPGSSVTVHSTADDALPAPGQPLSWPVAGTQDLSRLGSWDKYLGFFERPAAHGPFVGIYDPLQDAGAVRVFPPAVARGSKVFGLGWRTPLDPSLYTDDQSAYLELHGGLAPTFADQVTLAPGATIAWREQWYPINGIGDLRNAGSSGALNWAIAGNTLNIGFYPVRRLHGRLVVLQDGHAVVRLPLDAAPDAPLRRSVTLPGNSQGALSLRIEDAGGAVLLAAP